MNGFLTEPIILSGSQSAEFIESLRRPSRDYLNKVSDVFEKMDQEINIQRKNENLEVEISGLDLSFIDEMEDDAEAFRSNSNIEFKTQVSFKMEFSNKHYNYFTGIDWEQFETVSVIETQEQSMARREPCIYNEAGRNNKSAAVRNKDENLSGVCQMLQIVFAA